MEPAKVDDGLIEQLRMQEMSVKDAPDRLFKPRARVLLAEAPFADIERIYKIVDGERRVIVLIQLLSKQVRVCVAPSNLRKAG